MFIIIPVVTAVVLVFLGYVALWSACQESIPKGVAQFGKVMSIVLYVIAGLVITASLAFNHFPGPEMRHNLRCGNICADGPAQKQGFLKMRHMKGMSSLRQDEQPCGEDTEEINKAGKMPHFSRQGK